MRLTYILTLICLVSSAAIADDHTPLSFFVSGDEVFVTGEIDGDSLYDFEDIIEGQPQVKTLVLQHIGGSVDDEENLEFARVVREMGLSTRVPSDGLVASGGTDLFLAGARRVLDPGACVGVHSWAAEDFTATDLPRSDPEHQRYLDYYQDMEIAPAFYWFTLQAAPADAMHWMTAAQATRFGLTTNPTAPLGNTETCDGR